MRVVDLRFILLLCVSITAASVGYTSHYIETYIGNTTEGSTGDGKYATGPLVTTNGPFQIYHDEPSGLLYFTESNLCHVRVVDLTTNIIDRFAGTGESDNRGEPGLVDIGDGDLALNSVLRIPSGITGDTQGNIYIAQYATHIVRKVNSTNIISTFAGIYDSSGFSGDDSSAVNALLNTPSGLAIDASGDVYIADQGNNRIRRVSSSTGIISTYCGNGDPNGVDNTLPTSGSLAQPVGLFMHTSKILYIGESGGIRAVSAGKGLYTVAGYGTSSGASEGHALDLMLSFPHGIWVSGDGATLLFTEYYSYRVCQLNLTDMMVTTIAGTYYYPGYSGDGGLAINALIGQPLSLTAINSEQDIIIAFPNENVFRRLYVPPKVRTDFQGRYVETFVGTGTPGTGGDGLHIGEDYASVEIKDVKQMWADPAGKALYFSESSAHRVRVVNLTTNIIATFAGNGSIGAAGDGLNPINASIGYPFGIVGDGKGNIFVSQNSVHHVVRKISATVSGGGTLLTIDRYAGIYSEDKTLGYVSEGLAIAAPLSSPSALAVDTLNNVYIVDKGHSRVRRVDFITGNISDYAGDGNSSRKDSVIATSGSLYFPTGIAIDLRGNVYIGELQAVRMVTHDGALVTLVGLGEGVEVTGGIPYSGQGSEIELAQPCGLWVDPDGGSLLIAEQQNYLLYHMNLVTSYVEHIGGVAQSTDSSLENVKATASGWDLNQLWPISDDEMIVTDNAKLRRLYVPAPSNKKYAVHEINSLVGNGTVASTGDELEYTDAAVAVSDPLQMYLDRDNNLLYFTENSANVVRVVNLQTNIISRFAGDTSIGGDGDGSLATSASVGGPYGIGGDSAGNIFIAHNDDRVRMVNAGGIITLFAGGQSNAQGGVGDSGPATSAAFFSVQQLGVDPSSGDVYVNDLLDCRVRKITRSTGIISTFVNNGVCPNAIFVHKRGNVYLGSATIGRIQMVSSSGEVLTIAGRGYDAPGGCCFVDGFAADIQLDSVSSLWVSSDETSLLFAETPNPSSDSRVRLLDLSTKAVTTVGGGGQNTNDANTGDGGFVKDALFKKVGQGSLIGMDEAGSSFLLSCLDVIRIVTPPADPDPVSWFASITAYIQTYVGSGVNSSTGNGKLITSTLVSVQRPSQMWLDSSERYLMFTDLDDHTVRRVDMLTDVISAFAGMSGQWGVGGDGGSALNASLGSPFGIVADTVGRVYISQYEDHIIRRVDTDNIIKSFAGTLWSVYVPHGGVPVAATSAYFDHPAGLAIDRNGSIYVAESFRDVIRKIDYLSNLVTVYAGSGNNYRADSSDPLLASFQVPVGLLMDKKDNLYVSEITDPLENEIQATMNSGFIRVVSGETGAVTTLAGNFDGESDQSDFDSSPALHQSLYRPLGLWASADGSTLIFSEVARGKVRLLDLESGNLTTIAGNGSYMLPASVNSYSPGPGDGGLSVDTFLAEPFGVIGSDLSRAFLVAETNRIRMVFIESDSFDTVSHQPTPAPSVVPSATPSESPTYPPSATPSESPTYPPSVPPSESPTYLPSVTPSESPTYPPSVTPSESPTYPPSVTPSESPTYPPSVTPSESPTYPPSENPSVMPSITPSLAPSANPSSTPVNQPSNLPSTEPTFPPTVSNTSNGDGNGTATSVDELVLLWSEEIEQYLSSKSEAIEHYEFYLQGSGTVIGGTGTWSSALNKITSELLLSSGSSLTFSTLGSVPDSDPPIFSSPVQKYCTDSQQVERILKDLLDSSVLNQTLYHSCDGYSWTIAMCSSATVLRSLCVDCTNPCELSYSKGSRGGNSRQQVDSSRKLLESFPPPFFLVPDTDVTQGEYDTSTARVLSVQFVPLTPIPEVSTIETNQINITASSALFTVHVNAVSEEESATVHCGVTTDFDSLTELYNLHTFIDAQNFFGSVVKNQSIIHITGLEALTDYYVVCYVETGYGALSTAENIINTASTVTTGCCRRIQVSTTVSQTTENTVVPGFLSLKVSAVPSQSVSIVVRLRDVTTTNLVAQSFLQPSTLSLTSTSLSSSLQRSGALYQLPVGSYYFDVAVSGLSSAEYEVILVDGSGNSLPLGTTAIVVNADSVVPPSPLIQTARFSQQGTYITITFDSNTDRGGVGSTDFTCSRLFDFPCAASSLCKWTSLSVVQAYVNGVAECAEVGDTLQTKTGAVIKAECTASTPSSCTSWVSAGSSVEILQPTSPILPTVSIAAPSFIGQCDSALLDISSSLFSGGRSWSRKAASVISNQLDPTATDDLNVWLQSGYDLGPNTRISENWFEPGVTYTFTVELCNFLGQCNARTKQIGVLDSDVPEVSIPGLSQRTLLRRFPLRITAVATITTCAGGAEARSSGLSYSWKIYENGVQKLSLASTSKTPSIFSLPGYSLNAGSTYDIEVTVSTTSTIPSSSTASVSIVVGSSNVVAKLAGGAAKAVTMGRDAFVDASVSYDEDIPSITGADAGLLFSWACAQIAPVYNSSCADSVLFDESSTVEKLILSVNNDIPADIRVAFTVTVADSTNALRTSSATIVLQFLASNDPLSELGVNLFAGNINPNDVVHIYANVTASEASFLQADWTVFDQDGYLYEPSALSPQSSLIQFEDPPDGADFALAQLAFVIEANTLSPGASYTFAFDCSNADTGALISTSSILVTINLSPLPGRYTVNPLQGEELSQIFSNTAQFWQDDDLPMTYQFGYISPFQRYTILQVRSESSFTEFQLPADRGRTDNVVQVFVQVFDVLNANTTELESVTVTPLDSSGDDNDDAPTNNLLGWSEFNDQYVSNVTSALWADELTEDRVKQVVAYSNYLINRKICSSAPNCSALNRKPCGEVPNTCGQCVSADYIGEEGPSNYACTATATAAGYGDDDLEDEDGADIAMPDKVCVSNCFDQGVCSLQEVDTKEEVESCSIYDTSCVAVCVCDSEYELSQYCQYDTEEMELRRSTRTQVIDLLEYILNSEDSINENVLNWMTALADATQTVDELTDDTLTKASLLALDVSSNARSLGIQFAISGALLDGINSIALASLNELVSRRRVRRRQLGGTLDGYEVDEEFGVHVNSTLLSLKQFGSMTVEQMAQGQTPFTSVKSLFRMHAESVAPTLGSGMFSDSLSIGMPSTAAEQAIGVTPSSITIPREGSRNQSTAPLELVAVSLSSVLFTNGAGAEANSEYKVNSPVLTVQLSTAPCFQDQCDAIIVLQLEDILSITDRRRLWDSTLSVTCEKGKISQEVLTCGNGANITVECNGTAGEYSASCDFEELTAVCGVISGSSLLTNADTNSSSGCIVYAVTDTTVECQCPVTASQLRDTSSALYLMSGTDIFEAVTEEIASDEVTGFSVSYVALAESTTISIGTTFASAKDLTAKDLGRSWLGIVITFIFIALFCGMAYYGDVLDKHQRQNGDVKRGMNDKKVYFLKVAVRDEDQDEDRDAEWLSNSREIDKSNNSGSNAESDCSPGEVEISSHQIKANDFVPPVVASRAREKTKAKISIIGTEKGAMSRAAMGVTPQPAKEKAEEMVELSLPSMMRNISFVEKLKAEIKHHHRWISIKFLYNEHFPRKWRVLSLFTKIMIVLFIQSVTYRLVNPDDGFCAEQSTERSCLSEESEFRNGADKCVWSADKAKCTFHQPDSDFRIIIFVAFISALISIPIAIFSNWIISNVIVAPVIGADEEEEFKLDARLGAGATAAAAIRAGKKDQITSRFSTMTTRKPGGVTHHSDKSNKSKRGMFARFKESLSRRKHGLIAGRYGISELEERNQIPQEIRDEVEKFEEAVKRHRSTLDQDTLEEYDKLWCLDANGDFLSTDELNAALQVLADIIRTMDDSDRELEEMKKYTSPELLRQRLLFLFQCDILPGIEKHLLLYKTRRDFFTCLHVTRTENIIGIWCIVLLNLVMLTYILLFALGESPPRQVAWFVSFFLWFLLEIFVVSTNIVLFIHIVIPYFGTSDLTKIKKHLIESLETFYVTSEKEKKSPISGAAAPATTATSAPDDFDSIPAPSIPTSDKLVRATTTDSELELVSVNASMDSQALIVAAAAAAAAVANGATAEAEAHQEGNGFNVATHLFVSTRVAKHFLDYDEAQWICNYRTIWPKQSYRHTKNFSAMYNAKNAFLMRSIVQTAMAFFFSVVTVMDDAVLDLVIEMLVTTLVGYASYLHILLWNINPYLPFIPTICIYASVKLVTSVLTYYRSNPERKQRLDDRVNQMARACCSLIGNGSRYESSDIKVIPLDQDAAESLGSGSGSGRSGGAISVSVPREASLVISTDGDVEEGIRSFYSNNDSPDRRTHSPSRSMNRSMTERANMVGSEEAVRSQLSRILSIKKMSTGSTTKKSTGNLVPPSPSSLSSSK